MTVRKASTSPRQRIRRKLVRVIVLDPNNPSRRHRTADAIPMDGVLRIGQDAGSGGIGKKMRILRKPGYPAEVIAAYFGTTRAAVYQRLYRLRRSRSSDRPRTRSSTS